MTLLHESNGIAAYHCDWRALLPIIEAAGGCDSIMVDAPYSDRTHGAYRDMEEVGRSTLVYGAWSPADVADFVNAWVPLTRGWFVSLTDHVLWPAWEAALQSLDRYVFAPLSCIEPGSRVRLSGDGPSQWSVMAIVARPRTREAQKWGALPGGYVVGAADGWRGTNHGRSGVTGGKPLSLMRALVRDYTRPGDLVVDPCMGAGTTLLAARMEGRRAIGGDAMREHAEIAAERLRALPTADRKGTLSLFGKVGT